MVLNGKGEFMKKKLAVLIALILSVVMLASCDFQAQLESISNMIYDMATGMGGSFLEEQSSTSEKPSDSLLPSESDIESSESDSVPSEDSVSSGEATNTDTEVSTDTGNEPPAQPEPEPKPLPERNPATFDKLMGTNVDFVLPNPIPATNPLVVHARTNGYFSLVRVYKDFEDEMDEDYEQLALTRASTVYRSRTSLLLDIKFANFVESNEPLPTVYLEDAEAIALAIGESAIFAELKSAFVLISEATSESELTDASTELKNAIQNLKATYATLEGDELIAKATEIMTEALALQDNDMENPFSELFVNLALTLDEIIPSSEPTTPDGEKDTETESESESSTESEALAEVQPLSDPQAEGNDEEADEITDAQLIIAIDGAIDTLKTDIEPLLAELEDTAFKPLPEQKKTYRDLAKAIFKYESAYENQMLGNLRLIEIGKHPELGISAKNYAKIFSLAYDGEGSEDSDIGVIKANEDAKLVMGALKTPSLAYIQSFMEELALLRAEEQPVFVGAFNTEAFVPSSVTPESVYLAEDSELLKIAKYRDENYSHVELFVSAFGYNTLDSESDYYATEQRQADYLVRSMLIFAGIGVDNASICQLKDIEGTEYNGFGTITADNNAKLANYYLQIARKTLADYTFNSVVENAQGAMIYEFKNASNNKIYAVWNATDGDGVIENVLIPSSEGATLTELTGEYGDGVRSELTSSEGFISVNASATPKFVHIPAQIIAE